MAILRKILAFFSLLWEKFRSLFFRKKEYRPLGYVRDINVKEGPLSLLVIGKPKDENSITLHEMLQDAIANYSKYPINVSIRNELADIGPYPRLFVDGQLHKIGMITYAEIDSLIQKCIKLKKEIVQSKIKQMEELKRNFSWFICYGNPIYKTDRTEIIIPSEFILPREKNLRMDLRIRREGFSNTDPIKSAIRSRHQHIKDIRELDGVEPEEVIQIAEETTQI